MQSGKYTNLLNIEPFIYLSQGHIYAANKTFHQNEKGWLGFAKGQLMYRRINTDSSMQQNPLYKVNPMALKEEAKLLVAMPGKCLIITIQRQMLTDF